MKTIWKFDLYSVANSVEMPKGAEVLYASMQGGSARVWALVDPDAPKVSRKVWILGTGGDCSGLSPRAKYVNAFMDFSDISRMTFVYHVFDDGEQT